MVLFGIQPCASSYRVSGPEAERPDVRRQELIVDPIDPIGGKVQASAHPMIYVLVALVLANLVISLVIYDRMTVSPQSASTESQLPQYLGQESLSELADQIRVDFNSRNWTSLYDQFDPVAQVQFTQENLKEQFDKLGPLIGTIERAEYSHFKFLSRQDSGDLFELNYVLQVSGGTFASGVLKITFVDRGDHPGIYSVFINGKG
jgi:hypothetical protein